MRDHIRIFRLPELSHDPARFRPGLPENTGRIQRTAVMDCGIQISLADSRGRLARYASFGVTNKLI
jgi:hypothetical protein